VSRRAPGEADFRIPDVPKQTRLGFSEARGSIGRRLGDSVDRAEALRILLEVYRSLPEDDATRRVRAAQQAGIVPGRSV